MAAIGTDRKFRTFPQLGRLAQTECPLWVRLGSVGVLGSSLLCPHEPTSLARPVTSEKCQYRKIQDHSISSSALQLFSARQGISVFGICPALAGPDTNKTKRHLRAVFLFSKKAGANKQRA